MPCIFVCSNLLQPHFVEVTMRSIKFWICQQTYYLVIVGNYYTVTISILQYYYQHILSESKYVFAYAFQIFQLLSKEQHLGPQECNNLPTPLFQSRIVQVYLTTTVCPQNTSQYRKSDYQLHVYVLCIFLQNSCVFTNKQKSAEYIQRMVTSWVSRFSLFTRASIIS